MNTLNMVEDPEVLKSEIRSNLPPNIGWLEKTLSKEEIDHLWKCIDGRGESNKKNLAGHNSESQNLIDYDNWFFENTLIPLCNAYTDEFVNMGRYIPTNNTHPFFLSSFWVNYQLENEFQPMHDHVGIYSFVVWMKIPTDHTEQNNNPIALNSNAARISTFCFQYTDILGRVKEYPYELSPKMEGTILFFPSELLHSVYPFFNCKEQRISVSGNISLNTNFVIRND